MSEENVEIVRRIGHAFEAGDFAALGELCHPEVEWHEDPSFPEADVYRGIEAIAAYSKSFSSEFAEIHYEIVDLIDENDQVLAHMRITGTGRTSGAAFEMAGWWLYEFHDGKAVHCHAYLRREAALEAAGLSE